MSPNIIKALKQLLVAEKAFNDGELTDGALEVGNRGIPTRTADALTKAGICETYGIGTQTWIHFKNEFPKEELE